VASQGLCATSWWSGPRPARGSHGQGRAARRQAAGEPTRDGTCEAGGGAALVGKQGRRGRFQRLKKGRKKEEKKEYSRPHVKMPNYSFLQVLIYASLHRFEHVLVFMMLSTRVLRIDCLRAQLEMLLALGHGPSRRGATVSSQASAL
jgi:hypothetical protein